MEKNHFEKIISDIILNAIKASTYNKLKKLNDDVFNFNIIFDDELIYIKENIEKFPGQFSHLENLIGELQEI